MRKVFDPETNRRVHWKVLYRRKVRRIGAYIEMQLKEAMKGFIDLHNCSTVQKKMNTIALKFCPSKPIERITFNCTITPEGVKIEE